jgi:hypothetical protein
MGHRRRHCGIYLITHLPSGKLLCGQVIGCVHEMGQSLVKSIFDEDAP